MNDATEYFFELSDTEQAQEWIHHLAFNVNKPYGLLATTFLHQAVLKNNKSLIESLLSKKGVKINSKDGIGRIPLHQASDIETIKLLVQANADIKAKDNNDMTVLHHIAKSEWRNKTSKNIEEIIKYLVAVGADIKAKDNNGATPLHYVAANIGFRNTENINTAIKTLIEAGADIKAQDKSHKTALHYAADSKRIENIVEVIKTFLKAGVDIQSKDKDGVTVLHYAARSLKTENIECFVSAGADVNARDHQGLTPLHYAADSGKIDNIKCLIQLKANFDPQDKYGDSLIKAAIQGNTETVEWLAEQGVDVNVKNKEGYTLLEDMFIDYDPLALLVSFESSKYYLDVIRILLKHGAALAKGEARNLPQLIAVFVNINNTLLRPYLILAGINIQTADIETKYIEAYNCLKNIKSTLFFLLKGVKNDFNEFQLELLENQDMLKILSILPLIPKINKKNPRYSEFLMSIFQKLPLELTEQIIIHLKVDYLAKKAGLMPQSKADESKVSWVQKIVYFITKTFYVSRTQPSSIVMEFRQTPSEKLAFKIIETLCFSLIGTQFCDKLYDPSYIESLTQSPREFQLQERHNTSGPQI